MERIVNLCAEKLMQAFNKGGEKNIYKTWQSLGLPEVVLEINSRRYLWHYAGLYELKNVNVAVKCSKEDAVNVLRGLVSGTFIYIDQGKELIVLEMSSATRLCA